MAQVHLRSRICLLPSNLRPTTGAAPPGPSTVVKSGPKRCGRPQAVVRPELHHHAVSRVCCAPSAPTSARVSLLAIHPIGLAGLTTSHPGRWYMGQDLPAIWAEPWPSLEVVRSCFIFPNSRPARRYANCLLGKEDEPPPTRLWHAVVGRVP